MDTVPFSNPTSSLTGATGESLDPDCWAPSQLTHTNPARAPATADALNWKKG
ncbi:MAG: hypothetical protein KDN22_30885 [Verrucomicrobiae bacterium]|nr:hypothetical protein [Verrucomicrobiae bacterium]